MGLSKDGCAVGELSEKVIAGFIGSRQGLRRASTTQQGADPNVLAPLEIVRAGAEGGWHCLPDTPGCFASAALHLLIGLLRLSQTDRAELTLGSGFERVVGIPG